MASYCEVGEVGTLGGNAEALETLEPDQISQEINVQSDFMNSYFDGRFTLPLTDWDLSVRKCCAVLTFAALVESRGTGQEDAETLRQRVTYWTRWLEKIQAGGPRPLVTDSASPPADARSGFRGGKVISASSRGLTARGTGRCRLPFQGD